MAATYGRLTVQPGVLLGTLGPGATNLITPAAFAQLGAMPMFMIFTDKNRFKTSKQGRFQILDLWWILMRSSLVTNPPSRFVNGKHPSPHLGPRVHFRTGHRRKAGGRSIWN